MSDLYFSIAIHEGKAPVVIFHGYCRDDEHAIVRSSLDANGRLNSPSHYGTPLVSYRTVVLRNEASRPRSKAHGEPCNVRVLAGEGEPLSHEEWGVGEHRTIRAIKEAVA